MLQRKFLRHSANLSSADAFVSFEGGFLHSSLCIAGVRGLGKRRQRSNLVSVVKPGHYAGEEARVGFVAKDAKGFQKSLGGDVFTVSWERAGDDESATVGECAEFVLML